MAPGDVLLSHGKYHTIIGAERFHFRVRDGFGWGTLAIFTKHKQLTKEYISLKLFEHYMAKPLGQLVRVSSTPLSAYTPRLSTSSSSTNLQGALRPGISHLEAGFPLRCFQRLSIPHLATRPCHWRDNRYTRGASTPVLSY